jgi:hypothetical protein
MMEHPRSHGLRSDPIESLTERLLGATSKAHRWITSALVLVFGCLSRAQGIPNVCLKGPSLSHMRERRELVLAVATCGQNFDNGNVPHGKRVRN